MRNYDDWRLSSPDEGVEVFTTDEFNYTSEILANVEAFNDGMEAALETDWCDNWYVDQHEFLEDYAEELAKELGLK